MTTGGARGMPKIRINQFMKEDQVPLPRNKPIGIDNSYAARAEHLFNETRNILSREEQADLLNP